MFGRQWKSLCLLAGSLTGTLGLGLEEHPDVEAITVSVTNVPCVERVLIEIVADT